MQHGGGTLLRPTAATLLVGALALVGALGSVSTAAAAPRSPARGATGATGARALTSAPMTLGGTVPGMALVSSVANADGSYTVTWESLAGIGTEVQVTAPAGTAVTATQDTSDGVAVDVAVTPPATSKSGIGTGGAGGGASPAGEAPILNSWCTNLYLDKVKGVYQAHEKFCDIQHLVVNKGGGDWYITDEMSGTSSNGQAGNYWLWSTYAGDSYPAGNTVAKWAPTGSFHPSSCKTYTATLGYGGFSYAVPATYCPDSMDIYTDTLGGQGIEEFWHGCIWPGSVGFNPLDTVHNPPSASFNATMHAYMHLKNLC